MEKIVFRGKLILNGEWVYGNYVHALQFQGEALEHQIINFYTGTTFKVVGDTICRFIGEFDKKSEMIFEGDILKTDDDREFIGKVIFDNAKFIIIDNKGYFKLNPYWSGCKIIGNIFDNPQILNT